MTTSHISKGDLYRLLKDVLEMIEDNPSFVGTNTICFSDDLVRNQLEMYAGSCIMKLLMDNFKFSTSWETEMESQTSNVFYREIVRQHLYELMTDEDPIAELESSMSYGFLDDDGLLCEHIMEETGFLLFKCYADYTDEQVDKDGKIIHGETMYEFSKDNLELIELYGLKDEAESACEFFTPDSSSYLDFLIINKQRLVKFIESIPFLPKKWQDIANRAYALINIDISKHNGENIFWVFSDNYCEYPMDETYTSLGNRYLIGYIIIAALIDSFKLTEAST